MGGGCDVANIPPIVGAFVATWVVTFLVSLVKADAVLFALGLTPRDVVQAPFHPWTLLTYVMVADSLFVFIVAVIVILVDGHAAGPLLLPSSFAIVLLIPTILCGVMLFFGSYLVAAITGGAVDPTFTPFTGALVVAASVAVLGRQLVPQQHWMQTPTLVVMAAAVSDFLVDALSVKSGAALPATIASVMITYIYLRFLQPLPSRTTAGDVSLSFTFGALWPPGARKFADVLGTAAYAGARAAGYLDAWDAAYGVAVHQSATSTLLAKARSYEGRDGSSAAAINADRRRMVAAAALQKRLAEDAAASGRRPDADEEELTFTLEEGAEGAPEGGPTLV